MAVVPMCYKISYKDHHPRAQKALRGSMLDYSPASHVSGSSFPFPSKANKRWQLTYHHTETMKPRAVSASVESGGPKHSLTYHALESSTVQKQMRSLDSYFAKLQGKTNRPSVDSCEERTVSSDTNDENNAKEGLESLNVYLGKLNKNTRFKNKVLFSVDEKSTDEKQSAEPFSVRKDLKIYEKKQKGSLNFRKKKVDICSQSSQASEHNSTETSDLYLINILASINIAIFLFEIASPVKNSELELFSLPMLYGAKINDLIVVGEWWRLATPMFLHAGAFHLALGCWSLLTFGPQVCRAYGSFTFFLIYVLGGISGNLSSFLHTPELTVGGTGPVFAVIGAWLIHQVQNKNVYEKDVSDSLFDKAMITTALSFILSHFGPIDDWTHLGSVFTGIIYGFFTSPKTIQLDDAAPRSSQDEGIAIVGQYADHCKSLFVFTICVIFLSSLLLFIEPPLEITTQNELM